MLVLPAQHLQVRDGLWCETRDTLLLNSRSTMAYNSGDSLRHVWNCNTCCSGATAQIQVLAGLEWGFVLYSSLLLCSRSNMHVECSLAVYPPKMQHSSSKFDVQHASQAMWPRILLVNATVSDRRQLSPLHGVYQCFCYERDMKTASEQHEIAGKSTSREESCT